jgi:hypothetical protein
MEEVFLADCPIKPLVERSSRSMLTQIWRKRHKTPKNGTFLPQRPALKQAFI